MCICGVKQPLNCVLVCLPQITSPDWRLLFALIHDLFLSCWEKWVYCVLPPTLPLNFEIIYKRQDDFTLLQTFTYADSVKERDYMTTRPENVWCCGRVRYCHHLKFQYCLQTYMNKPSVYLSVQTDIINYLWLGGLKGRYFLTVLGPSCFEGQIM